MLGTLRKVGHSSRALPAAAAVAYTTHLSQQLCKLLAPRIVSSATQQTVLLTCSERHLNHPHLGQQLRQLRLPFQPVAQIKTHGPSRKYFSKASHLGQQLRQLLPLRPLGLAQPVQRLVQHIQVALQTRRNKETLHVTHLAI